MKVALSSDHRGYHGKEQIKAYLTSAGHEVIDFGCDGPASCDYPDMALGGATSVASGEADRGPVGRLPGIPAGVERFAPRSLRYRPRWRLRGRGDGGGTRVRAGAAGRRRDDAPRSLVHGLDRECELAAGRSRVHQPERTHPLTPVSGSIE